MGADQRVQRIRQSTTEQVGLVLMSDAFKVWAESESINPDDLVVFNNSFLFREGRSTTKSNKYLAAIAQPHGEWTGPPSVVSTESNINVQFKRISVRQRASYEVVDLDNAIAEQLQHLGPIVFSLVGRIGEAEPAEIGLAGVDGVSAVRYVPNQPALVAFVEGGISLSRLDNLDAIWSAIQSDLSNEEFDRQALSERFETTFHALQEGAGRPIDTDDVGNGEDEVPSILASIMARMEEQAMVYSTTLAQHRNTPNDNEVYNELLRVAYNFADGARAFLGLVVGICDLKPLIFWLTVSEQIELAHRFAQLPFSLVGKAKPSLERYRSVIANARNQAFHDVFAFDHPFRVRLPEDALRAPELRLFREYNRRGDPALTFEDRELVALFESLTRTAERPVPLGFWDGNEGVMAAVVDVVRALRRALIIARG
jgi:hypothetical protein